MIYIPSMNDIGLVLGATGTDISTTMLLVLGVLIELVGN